MKFQKLGRLKEFRAGVAHYTEHDKSSQYMGSQAACPVVMKDRIRVYFSARDSQKQSHCFFYDLNRDNPLEIIDTCTEPLIPLGKPGEFDEHGTMPSWANKDVIWFTGWNKTGRDDVRYRTACGYFVLKTKEKGILLDRLNNAPCGTSMPFQYVDGNYTYILYMSYIGWEDGEPLYEISEHTSYLGYEGTTEDYETLLHLKANEGGLARPVMFKNKLFYCKRGKTKYRTNRDESYKMFYCSLRNKKETPIEVEGCESDLMIAYGYPFQVDKKVYMLHNSDFTSPLVLSELVE